LGKKSGLDNVDIWAKRLGIELSEEQSNALLQEAKLMSHDLKRVLSEKEFRKLAKKVKAKS
jgi:isopropylmalate/homocitrate/citramalate synthase